MGLENGVGRRQGRDGPSWQGQSRFWLRRGSGCGYHYGRLSSISRAFCNYFERGTTNSPRLLEGCCRGLDNRALGTDLRLVGTLWRTPRTALFAPPPTPAPPPLPKHSPFISHLGLKLHSGHPFHCWRENLNWRIDLGVGVLVS